MIFLCNVHKCVINYFPVLADLSPQIECLPFLFQFLSDESLNLAVLLISLKVIQSLSSVGPIPNEVQSLFENFASDFENCLTHESVNVREAAKSVLKIACPSSLTNVYSDWDKYGQYYQNGWSSPPTPQKFDHW